MSRQSVDDEAPPAGTGTSIDRARRAGVAVGRSEEDVQVSAFNGSRIGILPAVSADLAGPLGDRVNPYFLVKL